MTLSFYLLIFFSPCSLPFPHSSGEEAAKEEGTIIFIIAEAPGLLHSGLIVNGHLGLPWIWIAGEETPKLQIPIFKRTVFLKQTHIVCHCLLQCCRAKRSPMCSLIPLVCQGCCSWALAPRVWSWRGFWLGDMPCSLPLLAPCILFAHPRWSGSEFDWLSKKDKQTVSTFPNF